MRKITYGLTALAASMFLAGCNNMGGAQSTEGLLQAGAGLYKAATLSDAEIVQMSDAACKQSDAESQVAGPKSKYTVRLNRLMKGFGNMTLNGQKVDYKVYMTKDVNAWAMGNGCVRVYAGLMDLMNDDELRGVIGHEMGHVALGHSKAAMQTAYTVSAARSAAGAAGGSVVSSLSQSQLGDLTEKFINAQFSQSQEIAADDYSFDLLTEKKMNRKGLVTAFEKLAKLESGAEHSMFDSHPSSPERAARMQERLAQSAKKK
ncbi:M48 family metalloprotease [Bordetella genomosp. 13]|uniref:Peptidase n=1 Tax=Bordetella genomosp. 13 TaxID=463040 RepID=A0A1W6ZAZ3_9BORD|nr:peptidase [Bordetella genomosp. 13]